MYSVLIEKIIRTVPDVGKIFLLIKAKSKEAAMQRLKTEVSLVCNFIPSIVNCFYPFLSYSLENNFGCPCLPGCRS